MFALACERISIKTHSVDKAYVLKDRKIVCRRVRALFSPEMLQARAVKGLKGVVVVTVVVVVVVVGWGGAVVLVC